MPSLHTEVAAVVVTYNRKDLLRQCIEHLLAQEGATCDVLVIDNASTDGTADMVASEFGDDPRVRRFDTGANIGGAGGFSVGIECAVEMGYEYVWVMDDDAMPSPTALRELLGAGEELGRWGFLSSAVYWTDGSPCEANRPKMDLFRHVGDGGYRGRPVPVLMGSFVSMLIPAEAVRTVGLPIGEYFIWTDDYEYSGRISKGYGRGWFVPTSVVTHAAASNTRADLATADASRLGRFRHLYRNDVHCYRRFGLAGRAYLAAKAAYSVTDVLKNAGGGQTSAPVHARARLSRRVWLQSSDQVCRCRSFEGGRRRIGMRRRERLNDVANRGRDVSTALPAVWLASHSVKEGVR